MAFVCIARIHPLGQLPANNLSAQRRLLRGALTQAWPNAAALILDQAICLSRYQTMLDLPSSRPKPQRG